MIVNNIADLNLHDSEWISTVVRTTEDGDENIVLDLNYLKDYNEFETTRKALIFVRCWGATFRMNFRYLGPESIFSATETTDSDLIGEISQKWEATNPAPIGQLRHFVITAGTTGSQLEVVAEDLILSNSS